MGKEQVVDFNTEKVFTRKIGIFCCKIFNTSALGPNLFDQLLFEAIFNVPVIIDPVVVLKKN